LIRFSQREIKGSDSLIGPPRREIKGSDSLILARLILLLLALVPAAVQAQHRSGLVADSGRYMLDGRPFQIISGELHYARVPRAYWRDRLRKARAMGLNTVSTYVFWNYHETTPGHYDFTGQHDIAAFIRIAGEEGLHVILRPGPYVCAEWELGGYPAWLLADTAMVLRSTYPGFTAPAARWLDTLGRRLAPLLWTHGGPIIAVQVENEYGSFDRDTSYMRWQLNALRHAGFGDALLYTADGPSQLPRGTLPDLPAVVNFGPGDADSAFAHLARFRPNGPRMSGEYWAGWFDQWGRRHNSTDPAPQERELAWMLAHGYSVNLYMFHGGTTPGMMNGANVDGGRYHPQTSSYDYDAALDESGRPRAKYFAFRDTIAKYTRQALPAVPASEATISVPAFAFRAAQPLWDLLGTPRHTSRPVPMEELGQSYGYILYRTVLPTAGKGMLVIRDLRDYAQVYVDGVLQGTIDRRLNQDSLQIAASHDGARLDILVENTGRVNFTKALRSERKGITHSVTFNGAELTGWDVFSIPMTVPPQPAKSRIKESDPLISQRGRPIKESDPLIGRLIGARVYRARVTLQRTGDTFLDTRGWGKGVVWVNGHQLGRYWSIGPEQTLYVPGPWLRKGANDIVVFDLEQPAHLTMQMLSHPILDELDAPEGE
jgi:beta-galactosidase